MHVLNMFVIYRNPAYSPEHYVVRRWAVDREGLRRGEVLGVMGTLDEARQAIPPGLVRLERDTFDDPVILEMWL